MDSLTAVSSSITHHISQACEGRDLKHSGREDPVLSVWSWNKFTSCTGNTYMDTFPHSCCLLKFIHILERGHISYRLGSAALEARSVPCSGSRQRRTNVLARQMAGGRWGNRHASCCIATKNNSPPSHSLSIKQHTNKPKMKSFEKFPTPYRQKDANVL